MHCQQVDEIYLYAAEVAALASSAVQLQLVCLIQLVCWPVHSINCSVLLWFRFLVQVWAQAEAADAWLNKVGSPAEAAAWVQQDPLLRLGHQLCRYLPEDMAGWWQQQLQPAEHT
jgi:hypothetical protein